MTRALIALSAQAACISDVGHIVQITGESTRAIETLAEAETQHPAILSVPVQLDPLNQIKFDQAPLDGPAEGVEYQLNFVCGCLP